MRKPSRPRGPSSANVPLPGLEADAAGFLVGTQAFTVDHLAGGLELVREPLVALQEGLHLGPLRGRPRLVGADEQHVAHTASFIAKVRPGCGRERPR